MADEFRQAAIEAGFSNKQIDFLEEHVAKYPHTHDAEDIIDFEEAVDEIIDEDEEEEVDYPHTKS